MARLRKQQEFIHLIQGGYSVDNYDQEFMRLKRFAPSLVNTEEKMDEKFVMGLDSGIRHMVEAIYPKTYEEALRRTKVLEKPKDEVRREKTVMVGHKWSYDSRDSDRWPPPSKPHYANRPAPQQVERYPTQCTDKHPRNQDGVRGKGEIGFKICRKLHGGRCKAKTRACFQCSQKGYIAINITAKNTEKST